jgi:hypothetical protein
MGRALADSAYQFGATRCGVLPGGASWLCHVLLKVVQLVDGAQGPLEPQRGARGEGVGVGFQQLWQQLAVAIVWAMGQLATGVFKR